MMKNIMMMNIISGVASPPLGDGGKRFFIQKITAVVLMLFIVSFTAQAQETDACRQATDMLRKLR